MLKLKLADNLKLPLDAVTEKLAWLGRTGSGKTYGAMKLAELMLAASAQIGVLDPVGVWRGLRVPAAKGGRSYDVVVFGGLTPDIPIEPTEAAGAVIADFVCDRTLSFVLDVSQFIPSEQQRIVRGFAGRFFQRRKAAPAAVHLFMEECQEFIPENPSGREEQMTLGVMQRLWKLGRNYGIGGSLISQRPQEVAKKALNMSGTLFAFQMTGPQERKAIRAWVVDHGIAADIEGVLQTLQRGQPHVEMRIETPERKVYEHSGVVAILPRVTADLSSTPKVGGSKVAARPLTPIDLKELGAQLQATIEKAKADDPRELRKRIVELERQLKAGIKNVPEGITNIPALTDADRALMEKLFDKLDALGKRGDEIITAATSRLGRQVPTAAAEYLNTTRNVALDASAEVSKRLQSAGFLKIIGKLAQLPLPATSTRHTPVRAMSNADSRSVVRPIARTDRPAPRAVSAVSGVSPESNGYLPPGEKATLIAAAQYDDGITREQASILTGYKRSSRDAYIQRLLGKGFVDIRGGNVVATDAGVTALGSDYEPLPTGEKAVLAIAIDAYPNAVDRNAFEEATGYKRSSRDAYIRRLQARQLLEKGGGPIMASAVLFEA